jgi:hypothetical protein
MQAIGHVLAAVATPTPEPRKTVDNRPPDWRDLLVSNIRKSGHAQSQEKTISDTAGADQK